MGIKGQINISTLNWPTLLKSIIVLLTFSLGSFGEKVKFRGALMQKRNTKVRKRKCFVKKGERS